MREEALIFAGVGLFRYRFDGTVIAMDRSTMRILELEAQYPSPDALIGKNVSELTRYILPCGTVREAINRLGRVHNLEYPLVTLRGHKKWVLHNSFLSTDQATGQPCVQAIIHDMTEHMLARRALRESEARFRCIFEQSSIGIARIDLDGVILESNPALQRMLGFAEGELLQMPITRFGHPDDQLLDRTLFQELLAGERDSFEIVKRFVRSDGQPIWGQLVFSLIRDAECQPGFAIGMLEDVTAREEADETRRQFLNLLTHELRTPLTNIIGWARQAIEEPDSATEALQIILRSAESQARMLNNLLEIARLYYRRFVLRLEETDVCAVIERAIETMRPCAEARGLALSWSPPSPLCVAGDHRRLHEVLCNLLDNALKFTAPGGTVTVLAAAQGRSVRVEVRDTGQGIAPAKLPTLFQPFPAPCVGHACGMRLGLAVAKMVVELHGGRITAESAGEGQGSTFAIELPAKPASAG